MTGLEFHFFPKKGVFLPTFMNGGELKFLGGIKKKKKHFRYFTVFNFIICINTNITKYVCYKNIYLHE